MPRSLYCHPPVAFCTIWTIPRPGLASRCFSSGALCPFFSFSIARAVSHALPSVWKDGSHESPEKVRFPKITLLVWSHADSLNSIYWRHLLREQNTNCWKRWRMIQQHGVFREMWYSLWRSFNPTPHGPRHNRGWRYNCLWLWWTLPLCSFGTTLLRVTHGFVYFFPSSCQFSVSFLRLGSESDSTAPVLPLRLSLADPTDFLCKPPLLQPPGFP